jgi:hypothetical protein
MNYEVLIVIIRYFLKINTEKTSIDIYIEQKTVTTT